MAVNNTDSVIEQAGNDVQLDYPFAFKILAATDLIVTKKNAAGVYSDALILGVDYTVVFDPIAETGTVSYIVAPVTGGSSKITRNTDLSQSTVLPREGNMPAKTIETMIDKLAMKVQELYVQVGAITVPTTIAVQQGTFAQMDALAGTTIFLARITDRRIFAVFLGDRTVGENGWQTLGGY